MIAASLIHRGSRQMIAKIPNFNLSLLGKDLARCARDLGVILMISLLSTIILLRPCHPECQA